MKAETIGKGVQCNLYNVKQGKLAPDLRIRREKDISIVFPPLGGFIGDSKVFFKGF
jgi:hypothetical protein